MSVIDDRVKKLLQLVDRPVSATEVSSVVGFGTFPVRSALEGLVAEDLAMETTVGDPPVRGYAPIKLKVVE